MNVWDQSLDIGPYTLFFLIAIIVSFFGCTVFAPKFGYPPKRMVAVLTVMLLTALMGARSLDAINNGDIYYVTPEKWWSLNAEGFSLYGGLLTGVISGLICCRIMHWNVLRFGDTLAPFVGIGIAIMRMGCFLHGCCFGTVTNLPWGITFPLLSPAHLYQMSQYGNYFYVLPVHPIQIYEIIAALFFSVIVFWLLHIKQPRGVAILFFMGGYSLFRLLVKPLRVELDTFWLSSYFYPAIYSIIVIVSIVYIIKLRTTSTDPLKRETRASI